MPSERLLFVFTCLVLAGCARPGRDSFKTCDTNEALSATYQVGPGKAYASLQDVVALLSPGDVVEVYGQPSAYAGGVVFSKSGTAANKITIRGVRVDGRRPVLSGATNTVQFDGSHY